MKIIFLALGVLGSLATRACSTDCPEETIYSAPEPFFSSYRSHDDIITQLTEWANTYRNIAKLQTYGLSVEGREMVAFKLASRITTVPRKRAIWINSGLHGQEWVAPATAMYMIRRLLNESDTPRIRNLLGKVDLHFTPLANPDGYEVTRTPGSRLFNKNRRPNPGGSFGVELNRNWDVHWSQVGGYPIYDSHFYYGPGPHSEPEVQALANYSLSIPDRYFGFDLGAYGQRILYPSAWANFTAPDQVIQIANLIKQGMAQDAYNYEVIRAYDHIPTSGTLLDWMVMKANIKALAIHLCPFSYSQIGFHLPIESFIGCAKPTYNSLLMAFESIATLYPW